MENDKKTPAELVADLMLEPFFVLVPKDRYEELVRAETERDVLEGALTGNCKYDADKVMTAILAARSRVARTAAEEETPEGEDDAE